jgi:hypothetical protein
MEWGVVGRAARGPRTGRSRDRWKKDNIKQGFGPSDLEGGPDPSQGTDTCHVPISWFVGPLCGIRWKFTFFGFLFWIHLDVVDIDLKFLVQSFLPKSMAISYIKISSLNFLTHIYGKFLYLEFLA